MIVPPPPLIELCSLREEEEEEEEEESVVPKMEIPLHVWALSEQNSVAVATGAIFVWVDLPDKTFGFSPPSSLPPGLSSPVLVCAQEGKTHLSHTQWS